MDFCSRGKNSSNLEADRRSHRESWEAWSCEAYRHTFDFILESLLLHLGGEKGEGTYHVEKPEKLMLPYLRNHVMICVSRGKHHMGVYDNKGPNIHPLLKRPPAGYPTIENPQKVSGAFPPPPPRTSDTCGDEPRNQKELGANAIFMTLGPT